MKKLLTLTFICLMIPVFVNGQTYSALWKQVKEAQDKDLPQTEQQVLQRIAEKAEREQAYGQLLKAELQHAHSQCEVAPDSLLPAVERLKARAEAAAADKVLQAVYHCVLGYIYQQNRWLDEDRHEEIGRDYYDKALADPDALAQVKAADYEPFVVTQQDSRYYGHDLLSIIGREARRYDVLHQYYVRSGNRRAALLSADMLLDQQQPDDMEPLNKSKHIQRLDSLIAQYQDLQECGEVAISRYRYMDDHTDATAEQKWQYINYALERWGDWQGMNQLRNAQRDLTALQYHATLEERVLIPQRQQTVTLDDMRGISELTMRLYKVAVEGNTGLNPDNSNDYKKLKQLLTPLTQHTTTHKYVGKRPYELFEDSMLLPQLPVGVYMLEFESQPATRTSRCLVFVSNLRVLTQELPAGRTRIVAVDATTGQPAKGVDVELCYGYRYDKAKSRHMTTDQQGECTYEWKDSECHYYTIRATSATDKACPLANNHGQFSFDGSQHRNTTTDIFTDRAIYRPGQTVHAAAIVYKTDDGRTHHAVEGDKMTFELMDANNQVVAKQQATTDAYGTCQAELTLPTQGLTGHFTLRANGTWHTIRVEEYKRPTFEVDIPRVAQNYEDGDTVVAHGNVRTYAGAPVQGAKVKYTVKRRTAYWWMSYSRYWGGGFFGTGSDDELMAEGETTTDEQGVFTVDMPMVLPQTRHPMFYNFVLTADVTDQGGETHQGQMSLPLGNRKTAFSATLPEKVLNEGNTKMAFHQQNAAGIDLDAQVRFRFDNGRWQQAKTNEVLALPQMKSGLHTLHAICQEDTLEQQFTVFSLNDTRPATDTRSWFYTSHNGQFPMSGDAVTVQAGSSDKNVHVVYTMISGTKVLESGATQLSNELINRKLNYKEEYGDGVLLTFAWMKEGKAYTYSTTIRRPMPDMHLAMKWHTFRNRLTPGQQEEWTLTVTKPDGTPAQAQLMATLYDKSLDQLAPHDWGLAPAVWLSTPSTHWMADTWGSAACRGWKHQGNLFAPTLAFSHFDHDVYPAYNYYSRRVFTTRMRAAGMGGNAVMAMAVAEEEGAMMDSAEPMFAAQKAAAPSAATADLEADESESEEQQEQQPVQMRENLQETAFFMPQLVCDTTGRVTMKFTLPESLTTWRFLGVAHTQDMMFGQMEDEAVARKDVMIQPNMPRFLRQDDRAVISARIINMSDQALSGTAMLQLLDPETEQVVMEQKQQTTVKDSSTVSVSFSVDCRQLKVQCPLYIARMSISTPKHSDGEQHYLPLLSSTERVTVSVPFTQTAPGTKEIDLRAMIPASVTDKSQATGMKPQLTIEYTNNPAWLMIQALPTVGHPHDDCAVCQAASLYANTIGRHILDQNPSAKHVFEMWSRERGSETSLMSSLQKNQELKDLVLNETPWVMDANEEQEQKQRLADFFEPNTIDNRMAQAVKKLNQLQNGDGSWSWWPGMRGSVYMTTAVAEMMVRLNHMTSQQEPTKAMLSKAFRFLGQDIVELVREMKKEEKKGIKQTFPSHQALQWLYICALDGRSLPQDVTEANAYLTNLLKKDIKNQTIYEKALSAIILQNKSYVKSLKEWTVYKEDMGRYYDTQRAGYSWRDYKIPTQVAAIEALKLLTPSDSVTISEMQRWLLQEKRNQAWDTPLNSADAIYAFLDGNSQALAPQARTVLAIDGKPLDTSEATAGIGYVKQAQTYNGEKTFTAQKTSTGTSWGAVYAQFMQKSTDISDQASGISVKRQLMVKDAAGNLQPLARQLKVGDRVTVRITIEADRDYDFVQLQDKRAACMEPVGQLSGYNWREGYYCTPRDNTTNYYFDLLSKGRHTITTEYYVDRQGSYDTGTCTVECAYSPEFRGTTHSITIEAGAATK